MMLLTISGNVPSQKNGKRIVSHGDKKRIISSQAVLDWKKDAVTELKLQFRGLVVTDYPIGISLVFYFDNLRRHDLDNAAAGVMDALTAAGVVEDDSVTYVDCLSLQYGGVDKKNPRVEIYLDE